MLTPDNLRDYQHVITDHMLAHPEAMVWAGMGLGKTIAALTAVQRLLDTGAITGALVIAPKRIIETVWEQEARKWSHTQNLTFSLILGSAAQRELALRRRADIYLVNPENVLWLQAKVTQHWPQRGRYYPVQLLVLDEITKFKNSNARRSVELLKMNSHFSRRIGLTGEPASNGYKDLFGQYRVLDDGKRLGTSKTAFNEAFLQPSGYSGYQWIATRTGREQIRNRIADITLELSESQVFHDLPEVTYNLIMVELPPKARKVYDAMEKSLFAELDSGSSLEVFQEASKVNKLLQIASGAAYLTVGGPWEAVHKEKMNALDDVLEEASGRPVLLGHTYIHEADRIRAAYPQGREGGASFLGSKLGTRAMNETLASWDRDEIPLLCGHPASMGHGLNLQGSSCDSAVWFSLPWSLELYKQFNARLIGGHRRQRPTVIHHIVATDTFDEVVYDTLQAKHQTQETLKKSLREYRQKRGM